MKVYLIINDEGFYKIGFTNRTTKKRIKELMTGSSSEMSIVYEYESNNSRQIEASLHNIYKSYKIHGEWFNLTDEIVAQFLSRCKIIDTAFNIVKRHKEINENIERGNPIGLRSRNCCTKRYKCEI